MHTPRAHRIALRTGLSYNVLEWGADSPAAAQHVVVLLHGFLDCAWTWQQTVDSGLFGRYRLIAPDLRGHGDSDRVGPGGYYYFMDYLADLHDLLSRPLSDAEVAQALGLLRSHPALTEARAVARQWADDARACLVPLPDGPARDALAAVCDYVVDRTA